MPLPPAPKKGEIREEWAPGTQRRRLGARPEQPGFDIALLPPRPQACAFGGSIL